MRPRPLADRIAVLPDVTFEAVRIRETSDLREVLGRVLPTLTYEQSSTMVRLWWQSDLRHRNATLSVG